MRLPPEALLRAAKRWLEILPTSGGIARAQALLTTHAKYSDLAPSQYATALTWLHELGLLEESGSHEPAARYLLRALFEKAPPLWVRDADELVRSPDELPADIISAGLALGLGPEEVFAQLVSTWGKVDTAVRERVGAAGEAALVSLLQESTRGHVDHVSTRSDGFGYDIDFSVGTVSAHMEVKSTTRVGRFTAYLSRHEFDVMLRDPDWVLVTVRLSADLDITGVGWIPSPWIAANAPRDASLSGKWASVKLEVPTDAIHSGVPQLGDEVASALPPW